MYNITNKVYYLQFYVEREDVSHFDKNCKVQSFQTHSGELLLTIFVLLEERLSLEQVGDVISYYTLFTDVQDLIGRCLCVQACNHPPSTSSCHIHGCSPSSLMQHTNAANARLSACLKLATYLNNSFNYCP